MEGIAARFCLGPTFPRSLLLEVGKRDESRNELLTWPRSRGKRLRS